MTTSTQEAWDKEDAVYRLGRIRELTLAVRTAQEKEDGLVGDLRKAREDRKLAQDKLSAFLDQESKPCPLFDPATRPRYDTLGGNPSPPPERTEPFVPRPIEGKQATLEDLSHANGTATKPVRTCRSCGCTEDDCRQCIAKLGEPCTWAKDDLCSACMYTCPDCQDEVEEGCVCPECGYDPLQCPRPAVTEPDPPRDKPALEVLERELHSIDLPPRWVNRLNDAGYRTVGHLWKLGLTGPPLAEQLGAIKGLGKEAGQAIADKVIRLICTPGLAETPLPPAPVESIMGPEGSAESRQAAIDASRALEAKIEFLKGEPIGPLGVTAYQLNMAVLPFHISVNAVANQRVAVFVHPIKLNDRLWVANSSQSSEHGRSWRIWPLYEPEQYASRFGNDAPGITPACFKAWMDDQGQETWMGVTVKVGSQKDTLTYLIGPRGESRVLIATNQVPAATAEDKPKPANKRSRKK